MEYSLQTRNNSVDEFLTPSDLAQAMVNQACYCDTRKFGMKQVKVLDPGANIGRIGTAVKNNIHLTNVRLYGIEILINVPHSDIYDVYLESTDYLTWQTDEEFDYIIGNPPYSHPTKDVAEKFVWKSESLLTNGGILVFLLRSAFRHSKARYYEQARKELGQGLFQYWYPSYIFDLIPRPSYYEKDIREEDHYGKQHTNMHDYSIYIWIKGYNGINNLGYAKSQPLVWRTNHESS